MSISVILVAYHGDSWLPACVESLARASRDRLHLVLVDNDGNQRLDRLDLRSFDVDLLRTSNPMGFSEANNFALVRASTLSDYVLFLNQDTVGEDGWIDRCTQCLDRDDSVGVLSPFIRTYDGGQWDPSFVACLKDSGKNPSDYDVSADSFVETMEVPAPAMIIKTRVLEATGPFDPIFGSYYEDYDLCARVRSLGFRTGFCSGAMIRHYSGSTTTSQERELKRMRQILRNRTIHRLRTRTGSRVSGFANYLAIDLPRRLVRRMLRRPGSQPATVTLSATSDLLRLAPRLLSQQRDQLEWQAYLGRLGWANPLHSRKQGEHV